MDQMRTWNASAVQTLGKLRWPAALPYLFASLKVGVAASLVGAIIGELPTGAVAGLGARMLSGSYYGQTVQIWSALVMAAILAAGLVGLIGLVERVTNRAMGGRRVRPALRDRALRRWRANRPAGRGIALGERRASQGLAVDRHCPGQSACGLGRHRSDAAGAAARRVWLSAGVNAGWRRCRSRRGAAAAAAGLRGDAAADLGAGGARGSG